MKEVLDFIVLTLFVFFVFMFIRGFNKQQIKKHKDRVEGNKKSNKEETK